MVGLVLVVEVVDWRCSDGNTISYVSRYLYYYNWVRWSCKYIDLSVGANGGNSIINNGSLLISLKQSVGVLVEMKTELIKMRQMVAISLMVEQGCIVIPVELHDTDTGAVDTHGTVKPYSYWFCRRNCWYSISWRRRRCLAKRLAQMEIVTLQVAMGVMVSIMYGV